MLSSLCQTSRTRTCCSTRWFVAALCAAALLACSGSELPLSEQDTGLENDAIEGDAAGDDADETDVTEEDADETDATEGDAAGDDADETDATETDATETDVTESDATESDATESDATETDATESDATETDATETDATESDATETDATESDAAGDVSSDADSLPIDADVAEEDAPPAEPVCGNGTIEGLEDCDDGDANSDTEPDACRTDCTFAFCGDGVVDAAETCDDGEANSDTEPDACRTDCRIPSCGDAVVDAEELCDDGEANSDTAADACRTDCTLARCGDGAVDVDEECDDGDLNSDTAPGACRTDCTVAFCGDGIVDTDEVCDDVDNPGAALGDCIPGCVGRVEQVLRMTLSSGGGVSSDFAAGATSIAAAADALCPDGFKAVITDGSTRVATVTPLAGDGQVDWVLQPFTAYYDEITNSSRWPQCCSTVFGGEPCCEDGVYTGQLVGTTGDVSLLGVQRGELVDLPGPNSLPYNRFDNSGRPVWTGFNPDWTAGPNCSGWTSTVREEAGVIGNSGFKNDGLWSVTTNDCGSFTRQVLCAEQPSL